MNSKALFASILALSCMFTSAFSQIEAGQSVIVKIMGVPPEQKAAIDETYPISENGMINLPFINELPAAGLKASQLSKSIQAAYKDGGIFNNAVIQVLANTTDEGPKEQRVHIGGQIRNPGPQPYTKGLTVYQAVQSGGGATEYGAMNRVVLWRAGKQQEINLKKAEGKGVLAQPNDTIEVPQKGWTGD